MSLVGTRPPTVDEWDKYELHHRARLATKPGLTGMWQVSGRSNITDLKDVPRLFNAVWFNSRYEGIQRKLSLDYDVYAFSNAVAYLKRNSYIEPTGVKGSYRVIKKKSKSVDESTEEFKTLNKELELKEMREKVKKCVRETYLELEKILDEEKPSVYGRNKHTYEDVTTLIEYMRKFDFIVEE